MTVVVDSSVILAALVDSAREGSWAETIVERESLFAPELLFAETTNALRRLEREGRISTSDVKGALDDLLGLQVTLYPFSPYSDRVWALRFNLTAYDAWYVAMAEALDCPLATLDLRLARASGTKCEFLLPHPIA